MGRSRKPGLAAELHKKETLKKKRKNTILVSYLFTLKILTYLFLPDVYHPGSDPGSDSGGGLVACNMLVVSSCKFSVCLLYIALCILLYGVHLVLNNFFFLS